MWRVCMNYLIFFIRQRYYCLNLIDLNFLFLTPYIKLINMITRPIKISLIHKNYIWVQIWLLMWGYDWWILYKYKYLYKYLLNFETYLNFDKYERSNTFSHPPLNFFIQKKINKHENDMFLFNLSLKNIMNGGEKINW